MRGTWDDLNRRLAGAVLALDLGDVIVIGEFPEPPRRLLRRAPEPAPARFVQVTAARTALVAECVGSTSFGGDWPMDPSTETELERLGWERPWSEELRTYIRDAPLANAPRLARACVRSLQVLDCTLESLEVRLVRDEETAGG